VVSEVRKKKKEGVAGNQEGDPPKAAFSLKRKEGD